MGKMIFSILTCSLLLICSCKEQKVDSDKESISQASIDETLKIATVNYIKAWKNKDFDSMQFLTSADITREANGEITSVNQEQLTTEMKFWYTAMPDFSIATNQLIAQENKTYTSWTSSGVNTGMFGEHPPTGKKCTTKGFTVLTFNDDGQIIHEQAFYDQLAVLEDWGYSITPPVME